MESKGSSNSRSGLSFIDLVRRYIHEILDREACNRQKILLYRTGVYWTAFERSAYRLEKCCGNASVIPMRILGVSHAVVTVGVEEDRLEVVPKGFETVKDGFNEKVFLMRDELDEAAYHRWHARKCAFIEEAMRKGKIFRRPDFPS